MQAEIIAIGDEILIGQTIDTNSSFIASQLNAIGIRVKQKRVIGDDHQTIINALDTILPGSQLIFLTGGLGPTNDDITKKTLTEYFDGKLVFHPEVYEWIKKLFATFNKIPSELNKNQAYLPDCCTPITNNSGTAAGMRFEREGRYYFSMPGVPYETEQMMSEQVIPWIEEKFQKGNVVHHSLLVQGIGESDLAERLEDWENALPEDLRLAYLPSPGIVKLRLSSYSHQREEAFEKIQYQFAQVHKILGSAVFGENAQTLQEVLGISLKERQMTISTAESCTGGHIAHLITTIPGSSDYFNGGAVTYSNRAKSKILGVDPQIIEDNGVVSQSVVEAMASGAREAFDTDFAIATSGVAGPAGGSKEKPVGTVWIAVAGPQGVRSKVFHFGTNRLRNIQKASWSALDLARREVQKIKK